MVSVIITAKNEAATVGRAIKSLEKQNYRDDDFEIIVVAPDGETLAAARRASREAIVLKDNGQGKSAAMMIAARQAKGERLIFSDGDVWADGRAVEELLKVEADLVSGRPVSINDNNNKYGWWQEILTQTAHKIRQERHKKDEFLSVSGYLFLIKRKVLNGFADQEGLLAEDQFLSYFARKRGYKIKYAPLAKVYVKYPDNYRDWVRQKIRTLGGNFQIPAEWKEDKEMRSLTRESAGAWPMWRTYGRGARQRMWLVLLFLARVDVWLRAWWKVKLLGQKSERIWLRVESSK